MKLLSPTAVAPRRAHDGDAGYDLFSDHDFVVGPGEIVAVDCGISIALPAGSAGLVLPRSGLASKHGIAPVNTPGLIDSGYRGPVKVVLTNHSSASFAAEAGERVAQLLLVSFLAPQPVIVGDLPASHDGRGDGGFGSTGSR